VASKWVVGVFLRESWRWNRRKKSSSSSPASRVQGKKKTWVPFKTAPFLAFLLFFLTVYETTPFFPKHAVSFKWIFGAKTCQIQNQAFNLRAFCILVLGLGFLQLSP
jgi:hypothetical protein